MTPQLSRPQPARRLRLAPASRRHSLIEWFARVRFEFGGLWRSLHPIPADRPLPLPTRDF